MSVSQLTTFLSKYNAEILVLAFAVYLLTNVIKKLLPQKYKAKIGLLPFLLAFIIYGSIAFFVHKNKDVLFMMKRGVQIGGVATLYFAFFKQFFKENVLKKTVSDILKGIMDANTISDVAKNVIKLYKESYTDEDVKQSIKQVIQTSTCVSEKECDVLCGLIVKALNKTK